MNLEGYAEVRGLNPSKKEHHCNQASQLKEKQEDSSIPIYDSESSCRSPQTVPEWNTIHLQASSSLSRSPLDAQSHHDNPEAKIQKQRLRLLRNSAIMVSGIKKTHELEGKIKCTSSGSTGSA